MYCQRVLYYTNRMLSIAHGLTGAFVATALPSPFLYVPLSLAMHYLEDWTLHWDVGTGLSNGSRKRQTAILLEFVDLGLMIGLIFWLWRTTGTPLNYHVWLGALTALVPDFLEAPRNFLKWEPAFLKPVNNFHKGFHHSTPNKLLGLAPQIVVIATVAFLLVRMQG